MMDQNKKIITVIPARMASSRFYGKPLAKILGKEMLKWVYEICEGSKLLKEVYVATDHEDIEAFCKANNMRYMMTSPEHKNCSERSNEVGQRLGADYVVEVQGDEPALAPSDVDAFVEAAFALKDFDMVTQYAEISAEEAEYPHNVKIVKASDDRAIFFSRSVVPHNFKNREVNYYKHVGLYLWKAEAIRRFSETPKCTLEHIEDTHMLRLIDHGFSVKLVKALRTAYGVDVPEDVAIVEDYLRSVVN
jgi:3-deoxy-manno-octulosonate cytidylyltransferase (CMP-KDO synthetase)